MLKMRLTRKSDSSEMVWFVDHEKNDIELEPCEMRSHHCRLAIQRLAAYEDTGLMPEEIEALKEKQKPKIVPDAAHLGRCPECDGEFNSELLDEYNIMFCPWCGQALDWED